MIVVSKFRQDFGLRPNIMEVNFILGLSEMIGIILIAAWRKKTGMHQSNFVCS